MNSPHHHHATGGAIMFPRLIAAASLRAALSRLPSAGAAGIALATGMAGMAVAADAQTAPMSTQS